MFELFKIVWDLVVLRDTAKKGKLTWQIWPVAFAVVFCEYALALTAVLLYEKHPGLKPLFVATMVFVVISLISFTWWAWRWQLRLATARTSRKNLADQAKPSVE